MNRRLLWSLLIVFMIALIGASAKMLMGTLAGPEPVTVEVDAPRAEDPAGPLQALASAIEAGDLAGASDRLDSLPVVARSGFAYDYLAACLRGRMRVGPAPIDRMIWRPRGGHHGVLDPSGGRVAYASVDGQIRVFEVSRPTLPPLVAKTIGGEAAVTSVAFSADGKTMASGHQKGRVVVWEVEKLVPKNLIDLEGGEDVIELALAPDGSKFAAGSGLKVHLWDVAEERQIALLGSWRSHSEQGLAFSPRGDRLAVGGLREEILFDAATGRVLSRPEGPGLVQGVAFSCDGRLLATISVQEEDWWLAVRDLREGRVVLHQEIQRRSIKGLSRSPDGRVLATIAGLAVSPDGQTVVTTVGLEERRLLFLDARTGVALLSLPCQKWGYDLRFTEDGRVLGWSQTEGYQIIGLPAR
jgi:WD40 repeat protein